MSDQQFSGDLPTSKHIRKFSTNNSERYWTPGVTLVNRIAITASRGYSFYNSVLLPKRKLSAAQKNVLILVV